MQWVSTEDLCVIILDEGVIDNHMPNNVMDSLKIVARKMDLEQHCGELEDIDPFEDSREGVKSNSNGVHQCSCGNTEKIDTPLEMVELQEAKKTDTALEMVELQEANEPAEPAMEPTEPVDNQQAKNGVGPELVEVHVHS